MDRQHAFYAYIICEFMYISATAKMISIQFVLIKSYSCQINITSQKAGLQFSTDTFEGCQSCVYGHSPILTYYCSQGTF